MESAHGNSAARAPWNKGKLALFNLAIDSKLRACDLVSLKVRDVCHGNDGEWTKESICLEPSACVDSCVRGDTWLLIFRSTRSSSSKQSK